MQFLALTTLLLAPLAASAGLVPARSVGPTLQPPVNPALLRPVTDSTVAPLLSAFVPRTNGQRMARGLAPLPPRALARRARLIQRRQNRPTHAARVGPSAVPVSGKMAAYDSSNNFLGFLAQAYNPWGESGLTTNAAAALQVSFAAPGDGSAFNVAASNPQASSLPYVGGIVGFGSTDDSMGAGSANYAYLGGVTATPPGSSAQPGASSFQTATGWPADIESAVWTYDAASSTLSPFWVNPDETTVPVSLVYMINEGTVAITGDAGELMASFPSEPMESITITIQ